MEIEGFCESCGFQTKVVMATTCGDLTLCLDCARTMAQSSQKCPFCDVPVTRLRGETNVRLPTEEERARYIFPCRFPSQDAEILTRARHRHAGFQEDGTFVVEKELEDGRIVRYEGRLRPSGQDYYLLVPIRGEFVAFRADDWVHVAKAPVVAQAQLNLQEAEAVMEKRDQLVDKTATRILKINPEDSNSKGDDQEDDILWGDIVYDEDSNSNSPESASPKSASPKSDDEED